MSHPFQSSKNCQTVTSSTIFIFNFKIYILIMREVTASIGSLVATAAHFRQGSWNLKMKQKQQYWQSKSQPVVINNQMMMMNQKQPSTYTSRMTTDIPLYESPGASFDRYLENKPRVFEAIFPDNRRSQRLNEEEWRIQMLPLEFLLVTVRPVIDMRLRCKTKGEDYPPQVPRDISKVLELDITRWELHGLDSVLQPSQFSLDVKGALYPDRRGERTRLKGQLEMRISFVLPPMLALVPEDVLENVADSVLKRLLENMKYKVNSSLLADYSEFKRGKPRKLV